MRKLLLCLGCLALLTTACGGGGEPEEAIATASPDPGGSVEECEDRTPPAPAKEETIEPSKPDIEVPDGAPPCELVIQDVHEGDGDEAPKGATVTVQYVGVSWSTGEEFDSSWESPEPITFPLSRVIVGWQEGIPGMKVGGRRQLIIPPDLGYGPAGNPPDIAPNETLIFIIDLLEVQ